MQQESRLFRFLADHFGKIWYALVFGVAALIVGAISWYIL